MKEKEREKATERIRERERKNLRKMIERELIHKGRLYSKIPLRLLDAS